MQIGMGVVRNRNGTWLVRKKVPQHLREPVARVLDNGKAEQAWLQKSTGTKDKAEAKRRAPAVMVGFAKVLQEAAGLLAERPLRTALAQSEIDRIAEFHFATVLAGDEEFTAEGAEADEDLARAIAGQLDEAGIDPVPVMFGGVIAGKLQPIPFDAERPPYGLTDRQVAKRDASLEWWLQNIRKASARGDISILAELITELLDQFHINLDPNSRAYRKLSMALLKADVRAHEALERRYRGEPIDTPLIAHLEPATSDTPGAFGASNRGKTLRAAFEGWRKEGGRSSSSLAEYERALSLFEQLHGDIPVAEIRKQHAVQFREALQDMPPSRPKELQGLTLPQLVEWRRDHPSEPTVATGTVNKLFGCAQTLARWASNNRLVPDDLRWSDPFSGMKLAESDEQRQRTALDCVTPGTSSTKPRVTNAALIASKVLNDTAWPVNPFGETDRRTHPVTATLLPCSVMAASPSLCCAFASATSRSPTKPSIACLSAALAFVPRCRSRASTVPIRRNTSSTSAWLLSVAARLVSEA
jgi:hypothetical protein